MNAVEIFFEFKIMSSFSKIMSNPSTIKGTFPPRAMAVGRPVLRVCFYTDYIFCCEIEATVNHWTMMILIELFDLNDIVFVFEQMILQYNDHRSLYLINSWLASYLRWIGLIRRRYFIYYLILLPVKNMIIIPGYIRANTGHRPFHRIRGLAPAQ